MKELPTTASHDRVNFTLVQNWPPLATDCLNTPPRLNNCQEEKHFFRYGLYCLQTNAVKIILKLRLSFCILILKPRWDRIIKQKWECCHWQRWHRNINKIQITKSTFASSENIYNHYIIISHGFMLEISCSPTSFHNFPHLNLIQSAYC